MFSRQHRTWSFHVVILQRTAKKCTKNYNGRAQLLFCSLNLLFGNALVAVVVVVYLSSLTRSALGCVLGQNTLLSIVPLSTQVYKLVLANLMLGLTLGWTSIPSMGE